MEHTMLQKERRGELTPEWTRSAIAYAPRVDILENDQELMFFADLPGVHPEHVDIRYEKGELVIHGRCAAQPQAARYLSCEYGVGDYYRAFTIYENIDPDGITAELKHGVLTVHVPKAEAAKPKRIQVTAGP